MYYAFLSFFFFFCFFFSLLKLRRFTSEGVHTSLLVRMGECLFGVALENGEECSCP